MNKELNNASIVPTTEYNKFLAQLKQKIINSRIKAVRLVNQELILLYHQIGKTILLQQEQQGWGAKVIEKLSKDLRTSFPDIKGFSSRNLKYMRLFAKLYRHDEIVQQVAAQLPWFHIVTILDKIKNPEVREFYIIKAVEYGWSRNLLIHQIELELHKREGQAITNFSDQLTAPHSNLAKQTLKDPYFFDFVGIGKEADERAIENALIEHIEKFLLELGAGFSFVGRQYHLKVGESDFFIDLLFYHLKLRSFVVVELKAGAFKPEYAGKLNFYLSAVDELLRHDNDAPSIGLILCKSKDNVVAEYALKDVNKPIGLAEYRITDSLPKKLKKSLPSIEELELELAKNINAEKDSNNG